MAGVRSGRVPFTDLTSYPMLVHQGVQRPAEHGWLAQRPPATIMGR